MAEIVCQHGRTIAEGCGECLSDEDWHVDKGEMVFVYQSDLQELFAWLHEQGLNIGKMNPRQAEAWSALQEDASA